MTTAQRGASRRIARSGVLLGAVALMVMMLTGAALASHDGWVAQAGASVDGDAIVLDTTDDVATPLGSSYEHPDLGVELEDGDTISFDYLLEEGAVCGGGQPRLFVEVGGTFFNTFDGNDEGDCGELTTGVGTSTDGTVVATYDGPDGTIGQAGIVFDNVSDRGIATITNVQIGDYDLVLEHEDDEELDKAACKNGGWVDHDFRNQGQCIRFVNTGKDSR